MPGLNFFLGLCVVLTDVLGHTFGWIWSQPRKKIPPCSVCACACSNSRSWRGNVWCLLRNTQALNSNHTLSVGQASLRAPFPLERLWETLHPSPLRDFAFDPKINCFQESAPCQILIISRWLSNIDHRLSMHRLSNIDQQWAGCRLLIIDLSCAYCQTSINLLTRGLG